MTKYGVPIAKSANPPAPAASAASTFNAASLAEGNVPQTEQLVQDAEDAAGSSSPFSTTGWKSSLLTDIVQNKKGGLTNTHLYTWGQKSAQDDDPQ
jgi:hypothetical protein